MSIIPSASSRAVATAPPWAKPGAPSWWGATVTSPLTPPPSGRIRRCRPAASSGPQARQLGGCVGYQPADTGAEAIGENARVTASGSVSTTAQRVAAYRLDFERGPAALGSPEADELLAREVAGDGDCERSSRME